MIQILKKQGIKAALPLLLLATACGEGGSPSAFEPGGNVISSDGSPEEIVKALSLDNDSLDSLVDETVASNALSADEPAAKVPEPTTLAGLAIAALGLGAIKRKQSA